MFTEYICVKNIGTLMLFLNMSGRTHWYIYSNFIHNINAYIQTIMAVLVIVNDTYSVMRIHDYQDINS